MRTRDIVLAIKNGDRVVYAANNGVEYNATALDIPHFGFNQALRAPGLFLNLAYFDEAGTVVKISAAPLLGSQADDEHLGEGAYESAKRDVRYHGSTGEDKEALVAEHFDKLKANPRTIGWRTGSVGDSQTGSADEAFNSAILWRGYAAAIENALIFMGFEAPRVASDKTRTTPPDPASLKQIGLGLGSHPPAQSNVPAAPSELERSYEETQPDLDAANAKSKLEAMAAEGNGGAAVTLDAMQKSSGIDGDAGNWTEAGQDTTGWPVEKGSETDVTLPSAADLDAVTAEQDTANATSTAESPADDSATQNDSAQPAA